MPVNYSKALSDGEGLSIGVKLLGKWNGSLYKLVWRDLIVYLTMYYCLNLLYRFALPEDQKRNFEKLVIFSDTMKENIPISFLIGFFVAGVISRWWQMWLTIPYLNKIGFLINGMVCGNTREEATRVRLLILRYMNLSWVLLMRKISDQIKYRFKEGEIDKDDENFNEQMLQKLNNDKVVKRTFKKLITDREIETFKTMKDKVELIYETKYEPEYWLPISWASRILKKAFIHGYISDPRTAAGLLEEFETVRCDMQSLEIYCSIMIPLVYTQVVIIAVYTYFLLELFSSQFVDPKQKLKGHEADFYVPAFTIFEFLFLMGWLKVAICVMNPFGEDDEDFPTSSILTEHLDVTYRCAIGHPEFYPPDLDSAQFKFWKQDFVDSDNLNDFLNELEEELDLVESDDDEDELNDVVVSGKLCCKKQTKQKHDGHIEITEIRKTPKRNLDDENNAKASLISE